MHKFRVICVLTVVLCLVVCVYANLEVTAEGAAKAAVEQAKAAVTAVHERAQSELNKANDLLRRVELSKNQAAQALSQAAKAPQDNKEAQEIAEKIKKLSGAVDTSYSGAQGKLSTAVSTLNTFVEEAQGLVNKPKIEIKANDGTTDDYTETNKEATALKGQADTLDGKITAALTPISELGANADEMESNVKEAQLGDFQLSAIVAVAKIKSMLASAENIILQIEGKKNEVSGIVDQMQTLQRNAPTVSDDNIKALHTNAANALTAATGAFDNAKRDKADTQKQKDLADAALAGVKAEKNDVSKAEGEVRKAEACVRAAQLIIQKLNSKLQTAETSATNAKPLKKKLMTALSTTTSAPTPEEVKETEKANLPVEQRTDLVQKDTTIQPTSKDLPDQTDKSTNKLKETLVNSAQNVPTTALTGGKAPAPGAKNDSAMTVSVPLLVALIASAVLK